MPRVSGIALWCNKKSPAGSGGAFSDYSVLEAGQNHKLVATIFGTAILFAGCRASGTFFAVRYDLEPRSVNTAIGHVTGNDRRAALAQCEVVFVGAAVIRVSLDPNANIGVPLHHVDFLIE